MGRATGVLEREHQVIQRAVAVMARIVEQLELKHSIDPDILRELVRFMRDFGDKCHHGKEESYLFPLLETRGVPPTGCPLAALKGEHVKGRQSTDDLAAAATVYLSNRESGRLRLIEVLQVLIALYPAHIWKEEYLLFPMTGKVLSADDDELLMQQFTVAESGLGPHAHETYEALADDLMRRVGECPECSIEKPPR